MEILLDLAPVFSLAAAGLIAWGATTMKVRHLEAGLEKIEQRHDAEDAALRHRIDNVAAELMAHKLDMAERMPRVESKVDTVIQMLQEERARG